MKFGDCIRPASANSIPIWIDSARPTVAASSWLAAVFTMST